MRLLDGDFLMREKKTIQLVNRVISNEELTQLAPFQALWPQDIPEEYQLLYIYEMSESPYESSGSGIFVLEYANVNDRGKPPDEQGRLFIWQGVNQHPHLENKHSVDNLRLNIGDIPVYQSEVGRIFRAFFSINTVNVEIEYFNIPKNVVERIASSLAFI